MKNAGDNIIRSLEERMRVRGNDILLDLTYDSQNDINGFLEYCKNRYEVVNVHDKFYRVYKLRS